MKKLKTDEELKHLDVYQFVLYCEANSLLPNKEFIRIFTRTQDQFSNKNQTNMIFAKKEGCNGK